MSLVDWLLQPTPTQGMIRYAAFATGFSANLPIQSIVFSLEDPHAATDGFIRGHTLASTTSHQAINSGWK